MNMLNLSQHVLLDVYGLHFSLYCHLVKAICVLVFFCEEYELLLNYILIFYGIMILVLDKWS